MKIFNDKNDRLLLILCVCFSILTSTNVWAQATEEAETKTLEQTPANEEEQPVIVKDQQAQKPQRKHGSVPRAMVPPTPTQQMELLAKDFTSKTGEWIDGDPPFFAIWQADRSGDAKGALLILHAQGEHPSWPQTTKPLHDSLPDYGWATLAISLPTPPERTIPARVLPAKIYKAPKTGEDTDENTENTNTEETEAEKEETNNTEQQTVAEAQPKPQPQSPSEKADDSKKYAEYSQAMEKRLTSALKFLHDKGQFNIAILGNGDNAIFAEQFMQSITPKITDKKLKDRFEKPVRALLIYNGSHKLKHEEEPYTGWFNDPDIPIFDAFTTHQLQHKKSTRHRQILANRKKVKSYTMVRIPEMSHETLWRENRLSRRIRSFLDAKVKGVEVSNAQLKNNNAN